MNRASNAHTHAAHKIRPKKKIVKNSHRRPTDRSAATLATNFRRLASTAQRPQATGTENVRRFKTNCALTECSESEGKPTRKKKEMKKRNAKWTGDIWCLNGMWSVNELLYNVFRCTAWRCSRTLSLSLTLAFDCGGWRDYSEIVV